MTSLLQTGQRAYETVRSRANLVFQSVLALVGNKPQHFRTADELWRTILPYTHGRGSGYVGNDRDPWPMVEIVG